MPRPRILEGGPAGRRYMSREGDDKTKKRMRKQEQIPTAPFKHD